MLELFASLAAHVANKVPQVHGEKSHRKHGLRNPVRRVRFKVAAVLSLDFSQIRYLFSVTLGDYPWGLFSQRGIK